VAWVTARQRLAGGKGCWCLIRDPTQVRRQFNERCGHKCHVYKSLNLNLHHLSIRCNSLFILFVTPGTTGILSIAVTVFQIIWFQLFQNGEYHLQRGIRERLESLDLSSVELQEATTFFGTPRLPDPVPTPEDVLEATKANQPCDG
jgi:hypothetical protein